VLCNPWWAPWYVILNIDATSLLTLADQMLRATHKIAEHALLSHETKRPSVWLFMYAILTAINSALRINWFGTPPRLLYSVLFNHV
jgi:hypothetical protein